MRQTKKQLEQRLARNIIAMEAAARCSSIFKAKRSCARNSTTARCGRSLNEPSVT